MNIRVATHADIPAIQRLIGDSVRGLSVDYYTPDQIESALIHVFGVDTQLIEDATYYVIEVDGVLAAAGGWSGRRTLFGGDHMKSADDPRLDPTSEPARIRAFFVHPSWARRGMARMLHDECERAACVAGFHAFELMSTMPGRPLYHALGFVEIEQVALPMADGVHLPLALMRRHIKTRDDP